MIWIGTAIATVGAVLCLTAAIGVVRMPDALSRLQVVTKVSTIGIAATALGVMIVLPRPGIIAMAFLTTGFLLLVAPISGHLVGRAAYRSGFAGVLSTDELAEALDGATTPRSDTEPFGDRPDREGGTA